MKGQFSVKSIIISISSIIGAIATFLPWLSASALGMTMTVYGRDGDGWFSFVLFVAILVLALIHIKKDFKVGVKIGIVILGILAMLVGLSKVFSAIDAGFTIGIGVYLTLIAGTVTTILPWVPIKENVK